MLDTARDTYNVMTAKLGANYSVAENDAATVGTSAQNLVDATSNGFKLRHTFSGLNGAHTYVGIAFAEAPQKYSTAR